MRDWCLHVCSEPPYNAFAQSGIQLVEMSRAVVSIVRRRRHLVSVSAVRSKRGGGAGDPAHAGEAAETMSARKLSDASEEQGGVAAPPVSRVEYAPTIVVQEKVLAEIAHELGNFFHKLYYWSDFLKEKQSRSKSADSTAAQMLERTIKNLEDFLKLALDYVHPTQLSFMRMGVSELLEGLLFQVRAHLNGTPVAVGDDEDWRGAQVQVMVDPSHLSHAFEVAVQIGRAHV